MKTFAVPFILAVVGSQASQAQLTVTSHTLGGSWSFQSDDDVFDGMYNIAGPVPLDIVEQSTVTAVRFPGPDLEATLLQRVSFRGLF